MSLLEAGASRCFFFFGGGGEDGSRRFGSSDLLYFLFSFFRLDRFLKE